MEDLKLKADMQSSVKSSALLLDEMYGGYFSKTIFSKTCPLIKRLGRSFFSKHTAEPSKHSPELFKHLPNLLKT